SVFARGRGRTEQVNGRSPIVYGNPILTRSPVIITCGGLLSTATCGPRASDEAANRRAGPERKRLA
ncbi:MAG TPA: hypothetical protein VNI02_03280, partial [Blastocatellia bacterium]|nr:hypothetical protein [Blastocatellia bacterium]